MKKISSITLSLLLALSLILVTTTAVLAYWVPPSNPVVCRTQKALPIPPLFPTRLRWWIPGNSPRASKPLINS